MSKVGLLRCPVCGKHCLCPMDDSESREAVKERASEHLQTHRLDESKFGIYRVQMTDHLEEIPIEDSTQPPVETWVSNTDELQALSN